MNNLKISQVYIGKPDAKDELIFADKAAEDLFLKTFYKPDYIDVDDFISGRRFYVYGLKGTGKTALLRYIDLNVRRKDNLAEFVLFKSKISEEQREEFASQEGAFSVTDDNTGNIFDQDFENIWRWYFHRVIADTIASNMSRFSSSSSDCARYAKFVTEISSESSGVSGLRRLIPKITKGEIEVSATPSAKLFLEWGANDSDKKKFKITDILFKADELFKNITMNSGSFYLFIDELEPKLASKRQYERDARLIRDLIVVIHQFNEMSHAAGRWLKIVAAVRSEVVHAVHTIDKEIEKLIQGFGRELNWTASVSEEDVSHPLIKMICHKIMVSEQIQGVAVSGELRGIWDRYFSHNGNRLSPKYILHKTWFKPRDLVRLLNLCIDKAPNAWVFTNTIIDAVAKKYAKFSWREIQAELAVKYQDKKQIEAFPVILTEFKAEFSYDEFVRHLNSLAKENTEVEMLSKAVKHGDILRELYKLGAIGNRNRENNTMRFAFRDDSEINLKSRIVIHQALLPEFNIPFNKDTYQANRRV
ncbi:P-loop ATPase, Sll1717 family [Ferrovibrio sp.]|uniref:P-loop ATPase, Sll1717 family n=1 Tax=Ferrovibrio sp. TaxID=1917215 RepID=UPI0035B0F871